MNTNRGFTAKLLETFRLFINHWYSGDRRGSDLPQRIANLRQEAMDDSRAYLHYHVETEKVSGV
jgi:hypothetical protein